MNKTPKPIFVIFGALAIGIVLLVVLTVVGQQAANRLKTEALATVNADSTRVFLTLQAQNTQTVQAVRAQATQAMATVNAQATARIQETKQIDLSLFPNGEIKVAVHLPLSGYASSQGIDTQRGAELALVQRAQSLVNLGFNVSIALYDDQENLEIALQNAQQIVRDSSILCVVGPLYSNTALPTSEEYHRAGLAMVSPGATHSDLTDHNYPEINRIIGRQDKQGAAAAQYARDQNIRSTFVVYTYFDEKIAADFKNTAEALGIEVMGFEQAEDSAQFDALALQIASLAPESVYFSGIYDQAALLFRQLRTNNYTGLLIGSDGLDHPDLLRVGGLSLKSGAGVIYTSPYDLYNSTTYLPEVKTFLQDFESYFGQPPEKVFFAMQGYDAMAICLQGIENAIRQKGTILTRDDVAAAIRALQDFPGVLNKISFNEKGDLVQAHYMIYKVTAPSANLWESNTFLGGVEITQTP